MEGPGRTTRRRAEPHTSTPGPTGVKGAGGAGETCRGAGGWRRGLAGTTQRHRHHWCGGRRRDRRAWLRCPWAVAGPGRASRRRAERSSRRGRLAGGPPPTGTPSSPAPQRGPPAPGTPAAPQATTQRKRAAAHRAATRSRSQWNTQRSRAATTSATWTAFRAAPLRRLSPETTRTRPRLPSTAWS